MKKLAIVSSYNEACGNASYAHVLKNAFSEHLDTDVIALDLFLLQKVNPIFIRAGDQHIRQIADKLRKYDYVNIQCEAGLYGPTPNDSYRRLKVLITACKNLTLTMHRIDPPTSLMEEIVLGKFKLWSPAAWTDRYFRTGYESLYRKLVRLCKKCNERANIWIAVHTVRDRRMAQLLYNYDRVFDHPITFLQPSQRSELLESDSRERFRDRYEIPSKQKVIGAFGFIGDYKGYETLVRALRHLPDEYVLFIFGSQHPQTIQKNVPFDPFLKKIVAEIDQETQNEIRDRGRRLRSFTSFEPSNDLVQDVLSYNLMRRVRFIGSLADELFIEAMHNVDAVVLPYMEVGQSMSGVIALALECDANVFCANNHSFNEVRRYFGEAFHSFDIGNYVELAQKIQNSKNNFQEIRNEGYSKYNIRTNTRLHLEKLGFLESGTRVAS